MSKNKLIGIFTILNTFVLLVPVSSICFGTEWPPIPFLDIEPIFIYAIIMPFLTNLILYFKYKNATLSFLFSVVLYLIFGVAALYGYMYMVEHFRPF